MATASKTKPNKPENMDLNKKWEWNMPHPDIPETYIRVDPFAKPPGLYAFIAPLAYKTRETGIVLQRFYYEKDQWDNYIINPANQKGKVKESFKETIELNPEMAENLVKQLTTLLQRIAVHNNNKCAF